MPFPRGRTVQDNGKTVNEYNRRRTQSWPSSPQKEILTKLEVLALRDPHVLQERATRICGREAGYRGEEQEKGERSGGTGRRGNKAAMAVVNGSSKWQQ